MFTKYGGWQRVEEYIKRDTREASQFEDKPKREETYLRDFEKDHKNIEENMLSCDDCGLMFENISDLARHMNKWCPENNVLRRKREDDEDDHKQSKKTRLEEQTNFDEGGRHSFHEISRIR